MIDVILKYADKATALADLVAHTGGDSGAIDWLRDRVLPDLKVWRNSQDVIGTALDGMGGTTTVVTHTYLPGYFLLVSVPGAIPALSNNAAVQFAAVRETGVVLRSTVGAAMLQDIRFAPVFAGCDYPWGQWK